MASLLVGNELPPPPLTPGDPGHAGLEMLAMGPTLRFADETVFALTGGEIDATLDGEPVPLWTAMSASRGRHADVSQGRSGRARVPRRRRRYRRAAVSRFALDLRRGVRRVASRDAR